uniref:Uncharacterized protein n=1 Tax=Globisporangium ultimum (strain ATCC 200006 / CBS 805.95 / DAOM BR144) TaxID=431595 RepID=K3W6R1_GLOUD
MAASSSFTIDQDAFEMARAILPSRHKLAGPLLKRVFEEELQRTVSIVTDGWSDPNSSSIVNVMVVAPDMSPAFWSSIATDTLQHSGTYLAREIEKVLDEVQ